MNKPADQTLVQRAIENIDRDRLIDLVVQLVNVPSPVIEPLAAVSVTRSFAVMFEAAPDSRMFPAMAPA